MSQKIISAIFRAKLFRHLILCRLRELKLGSGNKVLGRVACLGTDIFMLRRLHKDKNTELVNQQKTRVDYLIEAFNGGVQPKSNLISSHLARSDIYPLILQQERLPWLKVKDCSYLLMDSFSELTDQKFIHRKEGWSFFCNYSDVNHSSSFSRDFECLGLLPLGQIEISYSVYFKIIEEKYPGKQVVFIHFPTILDSRDQYKKRGSEILRVCQEVERKSGNLINIYLNDSLVAWNEKDRFPYHYSESTYDNFLNLWKEKH